MTNPTPRDSAQLPPLPADLKSLDGPIWPLLLEWHEAAWGDPAKHAAAQLDQAIAGQMQAYAREALRAQAASVEPVGLQQAYRLGFLRCTAWAGRDDLEHDVGSPAYLKDQANDLTPITTAGAPPAHIPADVGPLTRDVIDKLAKVLEVNSSEEIDPETIYAFARAIEARLTPHPRPVAASSPATAVDAVADTDIDTAALIETGFDGFGLQAMNIGDIRRIVRAALAARGGQVAASAMHDDAIGELAEKYATRDLVGDYLQTVEDIVRDTEAHHSINGLTVGGIQASGRVGK